MRAYLCRQCGQLVFFENSACLNCGAALGFEAGSRDLLALDEPVADRRCANAALIGCNWLVPAGSGALCASCQLTRIRPNDYDREAVEAWRRAEAAKRWLLFQLLELGLPIEDGLAFDLLADYDGTVMTGHADGVVTLNLSESDDAYRERVRHDMGEPYRTLLGHFRHEIGHYYWSLLVGDPGDPGVGDPGDPSRLDRARHLFGDERQDYDAALAHHHDAGAPVDWQGAYVSAYASMHPWEDWAETFAHYLHIRDTLQTAAAFGMLVVGPSTQPALMAAPSAEPQTSLEDIIDDWIPLTYALNAVNRSMGRDDLYPFVLAPAVIAKLAFVHQSVSRTATTKTTAH